MIGRARGFRVSLFGVHLDVVGDSADTVEALDRYVMPWLPREPVGAGAADGLVEVRRAGDGDGLEILVDGAVAGVAPSPLTAIPCVQRALDETWVRCQADVAVVHGGVVAHEGRAILLPGPTHAGKSTLVAELVRQGAPYFSDEYALIDADGRVHPYPRPLLLRDGSGYDQPRLATELGGMVAHEPLPAGLIVGVRHAPDASPSLQAISQADGVLLLLRNTPQVFVDRPWILRRCSAPSGMRPATPDCGRSPGGGRRDPPARVIRAARRCRSVAVRGVLFDLGRLVSQAPGDATPSAGRLDRRCGPGSAPRSPAPARARHRRALRAAHRESQRVSWHLGQRLESPRIAEVIGEREQRLRLAAEAIEHVGRQLPEQPMLSVPHAILEALEHRHRLSSQLRLDRGGNGDPQRLPQVAEHLPHPEDESPLRGVDQEALPVDRALAEDHHRIRHPANRRHLVPSGGVSAHVEQLIRRREDAESSPLECHRLGGGPEVVVGPAAAGLFEDPPVNVARHSRRMVERPRMLDAEESGGQAMARVPAEARGDLARALEIRGRTSTSTSAIGRRPGSR